jgi:hypothetical protein
MAAKDFDARIHVWLKGARCCQSPHWPAHRHNAELHSFVCYGRLTNTTWRFTESASGTRVIYEVSYENNQSVLRRTSKVGDLLMVDEDHVHAGLEYAVSPETFHATDVRRQEVAITLVLIAKKTNGSALVAGDASGKEAYIFDRTNVTDASVASSRTLVFDTLLRHLL